MFLLQQMRRNLLYHVYPVRGSIWRWNVEQIVRRAAVFDGKILVHVVTDARTVPFAEAAEPFSVMPGAEVVDLPNDPQLGEVAHFVAGMERLSSADPGTATFYAHAKGVRHAGERMEENVRAWAEAMYRINLDNMPRVEEALRAHAAAGCFPYRGVQGHDPGNHYAGTFFWFRNDAIFGLPAWREINRNYHGVENWLGRHLPFEKMFVLFDAPGMDLYFERIDSAMYRHVLLPESAA